MDASPPIIRKLPPMPQIRLKNGLVISRLINGMWQVSGAHGDIDPNKAVSAMHKYCEAGYTTFDMADIYGPAEIIFGNFIKNRVSYPPKNSVQGLTKMVPRAGPMTRNVVESAITKSMLRMQVKQLSCLQFHWWDYNDKRYLDALQHLSDLQGIGKIRELSLTNFDTARLEEITTKGIEISTNQVQYSIIDQRPTQRMSKFCRMHGVKLLTYGTLCGGLLTDDYLGRPEPRGRKDLYTASLWKYKQMIDAWGGWKLFQQLLSTLRNIADEHNVTIANVATRWVLDDPIVGGVIIGCRFGVSGANHAAENLQSVDTDWCLTEQNRAAIDLITSQSNDLMKSIGDCGAEYR